MNRRMKTSKTTGNAGRTAETIVAIVPAHGRSDLLEHCLTALAAAGFAPHEIVVADDASHDGGVVETAKRHGARVVRLDVNGGPAAARNAGAAAALEAEVLFFVDSDVLVADDARPRLDAAFADPATAAVFGCYDALPAEDGAVSLYVNLRHREVHRRAAGAAETFWTGCGAVRREAFNAVGGFDPASRWNYVEDVEFGHRLRRAGYRIRLDAALEGKHLKRWGLWTAARTDVLFRARPWTRLMLEEGRMARGLNADAAGRASMLVVPLVPLGAVAALWWPPALLLAVLALLTLPLMNPGLFAAFARARGLGFAAVCVPLHALHLACAALGLALGATQHFAARRTVSSRTRADLALEKVS